MAEVRLVREAVGNQNHPGLIMRPSLEAGGLKRSLTPILTGSNNAIGENATRSTMCDRWKGKGQRQGSGGKTVASLTSVLMF